MRARQPADPRQLSLLAGRPGSLDISLKISRALSDALTEQRRGGTGNRERVAHLMSALSGTRVTKAMLDRYAAASSTAWRFPLELLPAFVAATGDVRLLELVAEACGSIVLKPEERALLEWGALDLRELSLAERKAKIRTSETAPKLERLAEDLLTRLG